MSVYISGMEMPKSCNLCPFELSGDCLLNRDIICTYEPVTRAADCPLVPVPPHGKLIDADMLFKEMYRALIELEDKAEKELGFDEVLRRGMQWGHAVCVAAVHAAPVVIPADPAPRFDYPGPRDDDADLPEEVKG